MPPSTLQGNVKEEDEDSARKNNSKLTFHVFKSSDKISGK
jgi:hypothetical protein